jgi:protein-S-isoprenylcysteine O-methyltransferase Ste14
VELLAPAPVRISLFLCLSAVFLLLSWRPLQNPRSHGFYRFLVFETILALILLNLPYWFYNPFSPPQLLSWAMLITSIILVFNSVYLLKKLGGQKPRQEQPENFAFENTSRLVCAGIYRYVRHPMYSSLLLLAWGTSLKHLTLTTLAGALLTTILLIITAKVEERESLAFFGDRYLSYAQGTRMFIPFLF